MSSGANCPLNLVAREYIREMNVDISEELQEKLSVVMDQFISNIVTFDFAKKIFENYLGNISPLQKIAAILTQCNIPPSSSEARFHQAQALSGMTQKKMRQWTEVEDQRLLSGIHKFGTDNWALVAAHLGNTRSRAQCSQRWFRGLDPRILKATWTNEEEECLLDLVKQYGDHRWTKIANSMGNRSDAQCRYHYYQILKEKQGIKLRKRSKVLIIHPVSSAPPSSFPEPIQTNFQPNTLVTKSGPLPSIDELMASIARSSTIEKILS